MYVIEMALLVPVYTARIKKLRYFIMIGLRMTPLLKLFNIIRIAEEVVDFN